MPRLPPTKKESPLASSSSTDRILVGRIGRAHGLRGFVVVHSESDNPTRFRRGSRLTTEEGTILEIDSTTRAESDVLLVRFVGVGDRDGAESLRGKTLWIDSDDRRRLDEDEYWPDELVGARVVSTEGRDLGHVESFVEGAAQDRLVVVNPVGRFEIPFVAELVVSVDVTAREIVVQTITGLIDVP